jgi:3-dehydroquinate synthase
VKRIKVRLKPQSYDVLIGAGLLRQAGREVRRVLPSKGSRVFVVTSPNVRKRWGSVLEKSLERAKLPYVVLEMNDGEPAKHLATVEQLAEQMVQAGADRKSLVVALGGGVVGDSAGFLAAIFLRGVPVVQIPTTLQDRRKSKGRQEPGWSVPPAADCPGGSRCAEHAGRPRVSRRIV